MKSFDIAHRLAELGQTADAQTAYALALNQNDLMPEEELEAAVFLFTSQAEDYKPAYRTFVSLFNRGLYRGELLDLLAQAFYYPNVNDLQKRYEANCKHLSKYPYLFRRDFPAFEDLPILFFPFDDNGYLPFYPAEERFGDYTDFSEPVIDRYFFKDLENPILAKDVFSQYQLEYLNDNVRKSEWVGRENHIYLHYTDWMVFCAYLQCLRLKPLLKDEKFVFLIGDEVNLYPIDFLARFGIDYSQYPLKPVGIREVNRLIWHTQLATHNGGDFFNEIFYGHPNLLALDSVMFDFIKDFIMEGKEEWKDIDYCTTGVGQRLLSIPHPTVKDFFVALYLQLQEEQGTADPAARIVPALFFQPHFHNMVYSITASESSRACILSSEQYDAIRTSPLFTQFKYIKTFTPMRRLTTSYGATVRFLQNSIAQKSDGPIAAADALAIRLLNRSYMIDPQDRLYRDSVLVRFEDGKLNPSATFTALAEFLDIPYTETLTYCSNPSGVDPESFQGNDRGFSTGAIYRTYDEFVNDADRAILEYFLRDVYETYGYDFQYYHGETVDEDWIDKKLTETTLLDQFMENGYSCVYRQHFLEQGMDPETSEKISQEATQAKMDFFHKNRKHITMGLLEGLHFVNKDGQPLRMMTPLKLDPALLEQPLYH